MELPEKQPVRLWLKDLKIQVLIVKQTFKNEYHKSIKQNAAIAKSPTKTLKTQANHIFASLVAYVKFEKLKFATHNNHFALKSKLYLSALKAAFKELYHLQPPKADCVM